MAEADTRSRWIALYVLCLGMLMIILDATIVNVALPSIQDDLGFSQSDLAWVVNAYLIPFGGLLLLSGRVGDLIGRKDVFMAGLGLFVAASALCGLAQSQEMLIGARFLQGIGGALTSAVILGMIVTMFPEPREQAKAIGVYSFVASAGASIGLLAGGVLTEAINWHWIFFVNLPFGVLTAVFAYRLLERDEGIGLSRGADVPGALLITTSLMLGIYTIIEATDYGWGSTRTLALGAIALGLMAAFIARQATARTPLVPLQIFRNRNVTGANAIQVLMVAGMYGVFFLGALYMQGVLGYSAIEVGLAFLPVAALIGVFSVGVTDRLVTRFGARTPLTAGLVLVAAGLLLFTQVPVDGVYATDMLPTMILLGIGAGPRLPGRGDPRDVERDARGRRARQRAHQHDPSGRRRPRARDPGDALDDADREPGRGGREPGVGARRRLPARLLRRGRPAGSGGRAGDRRPQAGAGPRRGRGRGARARRGRAGVQRSRVDRTRIEPSPVLGGRTGTHVHSPQAAATRGFG